MSSWSIYLGCRRRHVCHRTEWLLHRSDFVVGVMPTNKILHVREEGHERALWCSRSTCLLTHTYLDGTYEPPKSWVNWMANRKQRSPASTKAVCIHLEFDKGTPVLSYSVTITAGTTSAANADNMGFAIFHCSDHATAADSATHVNTPKIFRARDCAELHGCYVTP